MLSKRRGARCSHGPVVVHRLAPAPVLGFLAVHAALRRDCTDLVTAASAGTDVADRLALLDRVLTAHHHGEDAVLLPLLRSKEPAITDASECIEEQHVGLDAAIERLRRATPWRDIAVVVPWLLDAVPDAFRTVAEGELPGPVRFAYRHGLRSRFERTWHRPAVVAAAV